MSNTHTILSKAILKVLMPLARILLRNGMSYGHFTELAKKAFVDVAFNDFVEPGKKQTISRVSALTGLTRKETSRLSTLKTDTRTESDQRYNRAVRVISGWTNDDFFTDKEGQPRILPISGNGRSFAQLVKQYSGDIPTQAMLTVLKKAGSVIETDEGMKLVNHAYVPGDDSVDKLNILGTDVAELLATIDHNLTNPPDKLFYQRKVSNTNVDPAALDDFRDLSASKAQSLLETLDTHLSNNEAPPTAADTGRYVCVGIYYYEQEETPEAKSK